MRKWVRVMVMMFNTTFNNEEKLV